MSLGSKYDAIIDFHMLLIAFMKTHEATTTEIKYPKKRIMKKVEQLYNNYFDLYKKNTTYKKLRRKKGHDYKQFEIIDNGHQEPKSTKKEPREKDLIKYKNHYGLNQIKMILMH